MAYKLNPITGNLDYYETETAASLLTKIETVDGTGSGLDADLLDGKHTGTSGNVVPLLDGNNTHSGTNTFSGGVTFNGGVTFLYAAKTTTYGIATTDNTINCTSGTFTVTLPTAASVAGKEYRIKNSGTGVITIATTSSQTIDGNASGVLVLYQYDALTVMSDGANWIIL